jgi:FSR family fosmidomycin resistance protein-like MFS transporter
MAARVAIPAVPRALWCTAAWFGVCHLIVDLASGFLVARALYPLTSPPWLAFALVIAYDAVAFAAQVPLGLLLDRLRAWRLAVPVGLVLEAVALVAMTVSPALAAVVVGVGNALYHLGAGALILQRAGARSAPAGVFVGPGAIGLAIGLWLGRGPWPTAWLVSALVLALCLSAALLAKVLRRTENAPPSPRAALGKNGLVLLCVALLFFSVLVRALCGDELSGHWRGISPEVVWGLAIAAALGKIAGGFVADHLGFRFTCVVALGGAALAFALGRDVAVVAVLGMFLLQLTMPVTLTAIGLALPNRSALAFGVPCLALFLGILPNAFGPFDFTRSPWLAVLLFAGAALCVVVGLGLLARLVDQPNRW